MGETRGKLVLATLLAGTAIFIGAFLGRVPATDPAATVSKTTVDQAATVDMVAVHVSGMVVAPGVVDVPGDAIVAHAIEAAGGLLAGALVDDINLAAPVTAGQQIVVPGPEDEVTGGGSGSEGNGLISLNQASAVELEGLPGVGPVLAERIVTHREANGRFDEVEDLLEVSGIGEAKLESIRDLVTP